VELPPGLTVVRGPNGAGKTNILEAAGYLATLSSFRGAPAEALVRNGAEFAVVRGEVVRAESPAEDAGGRGNNGGNDGVTDRNEGRVVLIEAEIRPHGRGRVALNRQPVQRASDLAEALSTSVFSPDDLELVKGGPSERRRYLDDLVVALRPRDAPLRHDLERIIRQRNALLSQAHGRLTPEVASTLEVWDSKLVVTGEGLASARASALQRLEPFVCKAYELLASAGRHGGAGSNVELSYEAAWREQGLAASLAIAREAELRRGLSLVGPHRDDIGLHLDSMPARTCSSQGEQRSLALALRLAAHQLLTSEWGEAPVLLLDDVFSELDAGRSQALVEHLPAGQAVLTTTSAAGVGLEAQAVLEVDAGRVSAVSGPGRRP
jgi:DNA replication and repair protein RecF